MKNLLFVVLLLVAAFNGLAYYKTGTIPLREWGEQAARDGFLATLKQVSPERLFNQSQQMINDIAPDSSVASPQQSLQISKWTDANGVVHYDNQPVKGAATIEIDPNTNVLPMAAPVKIEPEQKPAMDLNQEVQQGRERIQREMEARAGI